MTGRGDGRLFRPSPNAAVKLGLSLSTSSPTLHLTDPSPFFLIVSIRILSTPHPDSPITLTTHLNALGELSNRSFHNIVCVFPPDAVKSHKHIEIWPQGWPHYVWDSNDLRSSWEFVTVPMNGTLTIRHQLDLVKIAATKLEAGETYQASLTDKCLGTRWWAFSALEDFGNTRFRQWRAKMGDGDTEGKEPEGADSTAGEDPDDLTLVVEKGSVAFTVK